MKHVSSFLFFAFLLCLSSSWHGGEIDEREREREGVGVGMGMGMGEGIGEGEVLG
jgi:hypothetical protein